MAQHKQVVVLSEHADAHIPFVQQHSNAEWIIISPKDLIAGKQISLRIGKRGSVITFGSIELSNVTGVWYRKPQMVDHELLPVADELKDFCASAIERQYNMLLGAFPDAVWISDYYAGLRASNKFLQLQVARQLGFNIPETVITGSSEAAARFIKGHTPTITKRLAVAMPYVRGRQAVFMTTLVTDARKLDLQGLDVAPAIFQAAIDVKHDIRVTVVGDHAFPAYITSEERDAPQPVRDARFGQLNGSLEITAAPDFPKRIAELCIAHTKAMGLTFGALDIIEDVEGRFWFIENNAGGQWAYVEKATGQPIGRAIANLLESSR